HRLTTLRGYQGGSLSVRFRRGGPDRRTMLCGPKPCERTGAMWFAARERLTPRREWIRRLTPLRNYRAGSLRLRLRGCPDEEATEHHVGNYVRAGVDGRRRLVD